MSNPQIQFPPSTSPSRSSLNSLVILPSYNSGSQLVPTLRAALRYWRVVWVVIDGSTDGSDIAARNLAKTVRGLRVIVRPVNGGKGAAVLDGLRQAAASGFTHALIMDADGQHPANRIPQFMKLARSNPNCLVSGVPLFGPEAPKTRIYGRIGGNFFTNLETLWGGVKDSLFGFRVYPVQASVRLMDTIKGARGYDFDTEMAVRLYWAGFRTLNVPVPVRYFSKTEGGTSYFSYYRDNLLLVRTHARLLLEMIPNLGQLSKWAFLRRQPEKENRSPSIGRRFRTYH